VTQRRKNLVRISRRRGGFTLLELVVALGMIAILTIPLYQSVRLAFGARNSAEAAIEPPRSAFIALDILQRDLQNAMSPGGNFPQANTFEGTQVQDDRGHEADDIVFYSTAQAPNHVDSNGDINQIELTILDAANSTQRGHVLARRVTSNLLAQVTPTPDDEVICRDVSSLTFQYYTGSEWLPTWDSTQEDNQLPAAVQITLQIDRPLAGSTQTRTYTYSRIIPLPTSAAAEDTNINSGVAIQ
jgi:prepilin-type N-terminal cleavage/methylation domain-containing protein